MFFYLVYGIIFENVLKVNHYISKLKNSPTLMILSMNYKLGRIIGLLMFLVWSSFLVLYVLVVDVGFYYIQSGNVPPEWLQALYAIEIMQWDYFVTIQQAGWMAIVGYAIMWMGWQYMHPITTQSIQNESNPLYRRELVVNFNKEEFLKRLRASAPKGLYKRKKIKKNSK